MFKKGTNPQSIASKLAKKKKAYPALKTTVKNGRNCIIYLFSKTSEVCEL